MKSSRDVYGQLKTVLMHFTPDFEIMSGTAPSDSGKNDLNAFEQEELAGSDWG